MNIKEEKSKDYLKLNRLLQDLRLLRHSYAGTDNRKRIDRAIAELLPIKLELEEWLNNAIQPLGDYDI